MCLAIPGKITQIDINTNEAWIDYNGLVKKASTLLIFDIEINDYVLVHAGFIIQKLTKAYGEELKLLAEEVELV